MENNYYNLYNTTESIQEYTRREFGYFTTYTNIEEAWEWNLNIGACEYI